MKRELSTYVSTAIARAAPLERGLDFRAWQEGRGVITSTWGDYVTRLGERYPSDTLPELLERLCIPPEKLEDLSINFLRRNEFEEYKNYFMDQTYREATELYRPQIEKLRGRLEEIHNDYKVPDISAAREKASALQREIENADRRLNTQAQLTEAEHDIAQWERCMLRDALDSGTVISLKEYFSRVLGVDFLQPGSPPEELAHLWISAFTRSVQSLRYNLRHIADIMPVNRIIVGREMFDDMRGDLRITQPQFQAYYEARWGEVEPVFVPNFEAINRLIGR